MLSVLTFRTPDEAVEKANNTPYGLSAGVWTEKGSRILWMAQRLRAGVVWANTFNRFDPTSPFGGYKESGFGREGGVAGPRGLPDDGGVPMSERLEVRKTYKLFVGGAFPRSESGRTYEVTDADGTFLANAARASRKDGARRRARRPRRLRPVEHCDPVQPRPGAVSDRRGHGGPPRPVRRRRAGGGGVERHRRLRAGGRGDRPLGLVRRLGGQAGPGARHPRTRSPVRTSTSRSRSPPASWSWSHPRRRASSGCVSVVAPALVVRQRGHRARQPEPSDARRSRSPRCSRPATCPPAPSTSSPAMRPRSCRGSRPMRTSTPSTSPGSTIRRSRRAWSARRPARSPACAGRSRRRTGPRIPGLSRIRSFVETKTVWHPMGV